MTAETLSGKGFTRPPDIVRRMSARRAVVAVAVLISLTAAAAVFIGQASSTGTTGPDTTADELEALNSGTSIQTAVPFRIPEIRTDRGDVEIGAAPGRPTVLNFFAAWCAPCKRELPALREAAARNPDVAFVGIDYKDSREDAVELLDRMRITYPAGFDPKGDIATKYLLRAMPSTVFIAADGSVLKVHHGELTPTELREQLDRLTLRKPAA